MIVVVLRLLLLLPLSHRCYSGFDSHGPCSGELTLPTGAVCNVCNIIRVGFKQGYERHGQVGEWVLE